MRNLLLLTLFLSLSCLSLTIGADTEPPSATNLEIAWLNGEHTDLDSEIAPIRRGPLLLDISSPKHLLRVHSNRLSMTPVAGEEAGTLDIDMEVDFEGSGDLVIILHTDAGKGSTFEDQVTAPRQSIKVRGRAHFQPSPNGYVVTVLQAPGASETIELKMESRLAETLVSSCTAFAAFLGFDCDGLGESLSKAVIPLPESGTKFFVDGDRFSAQERAVLNGLLGAPPSN